MTIRINRVYTRGGDTGETSLASGQRVPKDSLRIEGYGTVDELNAVLGLARTANREPAGASESDRARLDALLLRLQNELFDLGADLATLPKDRHPNQPVIEERHVEALERDIDAFNAGLPELTSFVLPGGGWVSAFLHQARTVCRRAERVVTALARHEEIGPRSLVYLNRLSDLLFVLGRWAARARGETEPLWKPETG
jgi:cob(I)alamin adenosyltransferase